MFAKLRQHPLATVFLLALMLRLVAAFGIEQYCAKAGRQFLIEGDANGYWHLAGTIIDGEEYRVANRYALRMPGFPLLLAVVRQISGDSTLAVRVAIAVIGAVACAMVMLLGQLLINERAGWLAGLWTAVSPTLVGFTPLILTETVFAATLTASILMLQFTHQQLFCRRNGLWFAAATGASVAMATYIRPTWILAAPTFAVCLWLKHRSSSAIANGAIICLVSVLALVPWGIRNYKATGHFVLTTLWVGPSLYDGLHPQATGESDMTFIETDGLMMTLGEYKANQHYKDLAIQFATQNPGRAISLGVKKLARFWSPLPNADQFKSIGPQLACLIGFVPLMVLAIRGGWLSRNNLWTLALCAGPIVYFSLLHTLFVGSLRYRLPAEYPLSVLAAYGLSTRRQETKASSNGEQASQFS